MLNKRFELGLVITRVGLGRAANRVGGFTLHVLGLMLLLMALQGGLACECFQASRYFTLIWPLARVCPSVSCKRARIAERLA